LSGAPYIINIGLGRWQTPLVLAARDAGCRVIGVDINPHAPGVAASDVFLNLSAHEAQPIWDALDAHGLAKSEIKAVITIGSRGCLTCAAELADRLGVAGPVVDAAGIDQLVDRERFRRLLEANELPVPRYALVTGPDEPVAIDFPLIVKCATDTSGSEGLSVVERTEDLANAIRHAQNAISHQAVQRVVVEQYVEGRDVGVFGLFDQGELVFRANVLRQVDAHPHCLPKLYQAPASLTHDEEALLTRDFSKIALAVGVKTGPFYAEFRLSPSGSKCFALEAEPTLPAYAAQLIAAAFAVDLNQLFVARVVDNRSDSSIGGAVQLAACGFVYGDRPGWIREIESTEELPDGCEVHFLLKAGDYVDNTSAASICAAVFATGDSIEATVDVVRSVAAGVAVDIVETNAALT